MPELPEVETVRRGLHAALKGSVIRQVTLRRDNLRTPFPKDMAKTLAGETIKSVERRAKYLLFVLESGKVIIAHLGMSGRFSVEKALPKVLSKHDHVVFALKDGRAVIFNDPRRFGLIDIGEVKSLNKHPLFAHLGPDPLSKEFTPAYLKAALTRRNGAVKAALMDQSLVVGVGNIYAAEALFLAKIRPQHKARDVAKFAPVMVSAIREVLNAAIKSGGSSLRDFLHVSGESGYFQHRFNVYGRQGKPCFSCHTPLRGIRLAGRSSVFCPTCQK